MQRIGKACLIAFLAILVGIMGASPALGVPSPGDPNGTGSGICRPTITDGRIMGEHGLRMSTKTRCTEPVATIIITAFIKRNRVFTDVRADNMVVIHNPAIGVDYPLSVFGALGFCSGEPFGEVEVTIIRAKCETLFTYDRDNFTC